jgi:hypothetical protein
MNSAAWTTGPILPDQAFSKQDPFKASVYPVINEFPINPTAAGGNMLAAVYRSDG